MLSEKFVHGDSESKLLAQEDAKEFTKTVLSKFLEANVLEYPDSYISESSNKITYAKEVVENAFDNCEDNAFECWEQIELSNEIGIPEKLCWGIMIPAKIFFYGSAWYSSNQIMFTPSGCCAPYKNSRIAFAYNPSEPILDMGLTVPVGDVKKHELAHKAYELLGEGKGGASELFALYIQGENSPAVDMLKVLDHDWGRERFLEEIVHMKIHEIEDAYERIMRQHNQ